MSMAHEYYARFAAEERMEELRAEALAWRLARVGADHRSPAHRLGLVTTRVTAASSQAVRRLTAGRLMPGRLMPGRLVSGGPGLSRSASRGLVPGGPGPDRSAQGRSMTDGHAPQPCGC